MFNNDLFKQKNSQENCVIEFPSKLRSRKVVRRSNYRSTLKFPSYTAGRMIHCESALERDAAIIMDVNPSIHYLAEQPACIHYQIHNKWHKHYPDFHTKLDGHQLFIEVKYAEETFDEAFKERTEILSGYLKEKRYEYVVLTEEDIRKQPAFDNSVEVHKLGHIRHSKESIINALTILNKVPIKTLRELKLALPRGEVSIIYWLILNKHIAIDFNSVWSPHTPIVILEGVQ